MMQDTTGTLTQIIAVAPNIQIVIVFNATLSPWRIRENKEREERKEWRWENGRRDGGNGEGKMEGSGSLETVCDGSRRHLRGMWM